MNICSPAFSVLLPAAAAQAQLARLGGDDGRARPIDGPRSCVGCTIMRRSSSAVGTALRSRPERRGVWTRPTRRPVANGSISAERLIAGNTVDFCLSPKHDLAAAKALLLIRFGPNHHSLSADKHSKQLGWVAGSRPSTENATTACARWRSARSAQRELSHPGDFKLF